MNFIILILTILISIIFNYTIEENFSLYKENSRLLKENRELFYKLSIYRNSHLYDIDKINRIGGDNNA